MRRACALAAAADYQSVYQVRALSYLLPGGNRRRQTDSRFARKAKANTFCTPQDPTRDTVAVRFHTRSTVSQWLLAIAN